MTRLRWTLSVLFCLPLVAGPLAAQEVAGDPPVRWQADAAQNKRLARQAEKGALKAMPPRGHDGVRADKDDRGGPPDGDPPPDGGMGGGMRGMGGGPGGRGPAGGGRPSSPAAMLRPEMDFAAPLADTLLLYRTREALVFGRGGSTAVTMLPLSGDGTQIAPGVQAFVRQASGELHVEIVTSNDIHVDYRYRPDPADPASLKVLVEARGPGGRYQVERVYHRAAAK